MNKLDVALKLLQLLNERKMIDTRIVADELNVSLRTAQRYLLELSGVPCVITHEREHTYGLNPDYKLNGALLKVPGSENLLQEFQKAIQEAIKINEALCVMCGNNKQKLLEFPHNPTKNTLLHDNRQRVNHLVSLVRRKLKEGRCSFPGKGL